MSLGRIFSGCVRPHRITSAVYPSPGPRYSLYPVCRSFSSKAESSLESSSSSSPSSSGSTPYPFPTHARPTPHQIFHLSPTASKAEIKARYYELVRLHHPDSSQSRDIPSEIRNERFNSISAAYDVLRGVRPSLSSSSRPWRPSSYSTSSSTSSSNSEPPPPGGRRWKGRKNQWGGFDYEPEVAPHPDGLTEPFFLSRNGVMVALVAIVTLGILGVRMIYLSSPAMIAAQKHLEARQNLEEARRGGKERGEERRQELKKWIEEGGMKGFGADIGHGGPPQLRNVRVRTSKDVDGSKDNSVIEEEKS